jgi:hypothetical protein
MEPLAMEGHEGNVAWMKRQLREAQDTIVQVREEQRLSKERHTKHSRECKVIEKETRTTLANAQKKQVKLVFVSASANIRKILAVLKDTFP